MSRPVAPASRAPPRVSPPNSSVSPPTSLATVKRLEAAFERLPKDSSKDLKKRHALVLSGRGNHPNVGFFQIRKSNQLSRSQESSQSSSLSLSCSRQKFSPLTGAILLCELEGHHGMVYELRWTQNERFMLSAPGETAPKAFRILTVSLHSRTF